jgi:hypothetical protein
LFGRQAEAESAHAVIIGRLQAVEHPHSFVGENSRAEKEKRRKDSNSFHKISDFFDKSTVFFLKNQAKQT